MIFGDAVFMVIYRNPTGRHLLVSFRGGWLNWLPASEDPNFQRLGAWWEGLPMGFAVLPGVAAPGHVYQGVPLIELGNTIRTNCRYLTFD